MLMRPMRLIKRRREPPRRGVMRTEAYAALHRITILGLAGRIVKMGAIHMRAEAAGRLRCDLTCQAVQAVQAVHPVASNDQSS